MQWVCHTAVMTKVRVSKRSDLDMRESGNGGSDAPGDVALEIATAVTRIATGTVGATTLELLGRNENRTWTRRSEAPVTAMAPSNWRSSVERMIGQQAQ
jgi:hypothetical protein